jgi:tetratricopeptide (TPR) repeat protein
MEALARRNEARALLATASTLVQNATDATTYREAINTLYQAVRLDPGYHEPRWHLAELFEVLGEMQQARDNYVAALTLDPQVQNDGTAAGRVYGNVGRLFEIAGDLTSVRRFYNRYLTMYALAPEASYMARRLLLLTPCAGNWFEKFQEGARAQLESHHEAAVEAFNDSLRLYPQGSCIYILRAFSLRASGNHDEAVRDLENALELDPHARTYVEMGITYAMVGNPYVEEGFYTRALQASPHDALAMYHLGAAAYARKDRDAALEMLQKAVESAPDAPWATKAASFIDDILRAGDVDFPECLIEPIHWQRWKHEMEGVDIPYPSKAQIISHLETGNLVAFVDNPENRLFYFRVRRMAAPDNFEREAFIRMQEKGFQRRTDMKVENVERMEVSGHGVFFTEHREIKTDFMLMQAWLFRQDEIFEYWCRSPWVVYRRARGSYMTVLTGSVILSRDDLLALRKRIYEECVARQPFDTEALAGLGAALIGLGDLEYAQQIYTRILQLDPDNARALGDLGMCYWKLNRLDLAIAALTKATAKSPTRQLWKTLGMAYEHKKESDKAVKVYLKALETRPEKELMLLLGASYESLKKFDLAEAEYRKVITIDPRDLNAQLRLGTLLSRLKRKDEAIKQLKEAVALDGRSIDAHMAIGIAYMEAGLWDMSEKSFHQVLRINNDYDAARAALEELAVRKKKSRKY